ncbi:YdeI/OmpD-associated family protein [Pedobacter caeni]|uniref:Bacteriocin-protection, YdeI or OmpD-Associated n=1 Tax=Pedobacter caeni TaxID=288992 RepID=A0A1M4V1B6_9SPHI|nr:YdeI/OmpD-associated family protein [Pedobacter caeni]SHE62776.1 Bacteriocin-protection, YdeI or OmpD-Associated [Pedobacter caeni]
MDNKLLKKLHVKPGFKLLIENAPENVAALLGDFDAVQLSFNATQGFDALLLFVLNSYELKEQLSLLASGLKPDTLFWIAYPKKTSGMESDLHMMAPWDEVKAYQLTPCASISISEVWTGIRLKPIDLVKASAVRNENIQQNDFSKYVDVVNKKVIPPADLDQALHEQPLALSYFESLAYSHKKEYVLWILTAKQEKTRLSRIEKMIEMLLAKRKNPNDK